MDDLSLPPQSVMARQQAQIDQAIAQNEQAMREARRATAINLAVQLSTGRADSILDVLGNAIKIAHYIDTGQVPSEAKRR